MVKIVSFLVFGFFIVGLADSSFASSFPEWDGVYLKDVDGNYEELKEVASVRVNSSPSGTIYYSTKDYTIISPKKFKGLIIKGKDLITDVKFRPLERNTEISLSALFNRSKAKFQDLFSLESRKGYFELRSRHEGDDARYYEPPKEAMQFFGSAEKGYFVLLNVANGKYYIFGIDSVANENTQAMR